MDLEDSLGFTYILHGAVCFLTFYEIYTVRNFTVEALVNLNKQYNFSHIFSFLFGPFLDMVLDSYPYPYPFIS